MKEVSSLKEKSMGGPYSLVASMAADVSLGDLIAVITATIGHCSDLFMASS